MDYSPNTQALPAGTQLEEFLIERVLGAGGFGITYLATDTALGRRVVIKENLPVQFCFRDTRSLTVVPRHTTGEDADNFAWSLENFSREAAMLASLDHPGIVRVLRSFQAFGTAYFVMPYVDGIALDELVKQRSGKPFSEDELRGLLERVLGALSYLHDRGIYHRDIKPGNILITSEGMPVLIDFGSARQRLSERSMTVVESAGYTPFEQLQSRGNVGPWSDLYAVGASLVKLMTGETPPKTNDRSFGDPWQPLGGRKELDGRFSATFLSGVDKALRLPIEDRWKNAGEWLAALRGGVIVGNPPAVPTIVESPPVTSERSFWNIKHSWMLAACVVLGLFWATVRDESIRQKSERDATLAAEPRAEKVAEQERPVMIAQTNSSRDAAPLNAESTERISLKTTKGKIVIELNREKAPITVENFLNYVEDKFYDDTVFHRIIDGFVIQGGGMEMKDGRLVEKPTRAGIRNESNNGLKNVVGSIAMARTNDPNSATAQFFINVNDNRSLDYPNLNGYAVFGKVIEGMEVVNAIKRVPTGANDVPREAVVIESVSVIR